MEIIKGLTHEEVEEKIKQGKSNKVKIKTLFIVQIDNKSKNKNKRKYFKNIKKKYIYIL